MEEKHNCQDCFWVNEDKCILLKDENDNWESVLDGPNDCEFFIDDDGSLLSRR